MMPSLQFPPGRRPYGPEAKAPGAFHQPRKGIITIIEMLDVTTL